ncbi:hypothetical protein [Streptomyces sp. NPDC047042]|uniref:hypothetical protein n=1 Tax=Streptomyces sp. NPDC047042 TaxID=3154807 RepID=UPI0033C0E73F
MDPPRGAGEHRRSRAARHGGGRHRRPYRLTLRRFWERPREIEVATGEGGHGGGDARMLEDVIGTPAPDPLHRAAGAADGARSLVTGLAANRSFETGLPVRTRDLLEV